MLPAIDFDVLEYHLQGPKEYYQAGRIYVLASQRLHEHAVRRGDAPPVGMEVLGDWWWGVLVGQFLVALYAPTAAVLIAARRPRGWARPRAGLARGDRLSDDALDLPARRDRLRRGPALLLPRGPGLGGGPRLERRGRAAGAALGLGRLARRRGDGLQVHGADLGGHPFGRGWPWSTRRGSRSCEAGRRPSSWGGRSSWPPGWPRTWSTRAIPSIRWPSKVFGGGTGTPARRGPVVTRPRARGRSRQAPCGIRLVDVAGRSDWQSPLYLAFAPLALLRAANAESGAGGRRLRGCTSS